MIPNDDETIKRTLFMFPWRINDENSHEWTLLLEGTYKHSIILDFLLHVDKKQLNKRNQDNKTPLHWHHCLVILTVFLFYYLMEQIVI